MKSGAKITPETVFDIASVSKQFTATAILLLAHSGKLGFNDALSDHVHGLPAWSTEVTMKQLMHHTSGIPDYLQLLADKRSPRHRPDNPQTGHEVTDHREAALQARLGVGVLQLELPAARA